MFVVVFVLFVGVLDQLVQLVIVCWWGSEVYEVSFDVMCVFIDMCMVDIGDEIWVVEYLFVYMFGQVGDLVYLLVVDSGVLFVKVDCGG